MIPSGNVDECLIRVQQRWDIRPIRNLMIFIGPISSIYDFQAFYVLSHFFPAGEPLFYTGWFIEFLATQTLVSVIRTMGIPFRIWPSVPLAISTVAISVLGGLLPFSPLAGILGFTPLPVPFFTFLLMSTVT